MEKLPELARKLVESPNIFKEFKALMKTYSSNYHTQFYQSAKKWKHLSYPTVPENKTREKDTTCLFGPGK